MKLKPRLRSGLLALVLILAGCASPTQPKAMKVENLSLGKRFNKTVAVQTNGGQPTSPMWTSQVADKDLAQAISESLSSSGLFSAVVSLGQGDFVLNATIVNLNQPMIGFTMSVTIELVWSLTPKGQNKPCWEKSIATRAEKTVGDAFAGVTRLRIATEAAVQENIRQALTELAQVQLPEG